MSAPLPLDAEFCPSCGHEQPCDRRACLDALAAQADYYDEESLKDPR